MTIRAMLRGGSRPITLVPIYIGYEHVMEVGTYAKELRGATKEKESLPQMMRGLSKLRNLGRGYVNFGEPLPLMTLSQSARAGMARSHRSYRSRPPFPADADGE